MRTFQWFSFVALSWDFGMVSSNVFYFCVKFVRLRPFVWHYHQNGKLTHSQKSTSTLNYLSGHRQTIGQQKDNALRKQHYSTKIE